jgi:hypothetical protein
MLWKLERGYIGAGVYPLREASEDQRKYYWHVAKAVPLEIINQAYAATHDAKERGELKDPNAYFAQVVKEMTNGGGK